MDVSFFFKFQYRYSFSVKNSYIEEHSLTKLEILNSVKVSISLV